MPLLLEIDPGTGCSKRHTYFRAKMSGYFWPEEENEGGHIVEQLDCNLKVINKTPSIISRAKPAILYLAGHHRKLANRESTVDNFLNYVRRHPDTSCVIISTGWDTEPDQQNDPRIYRTLPPIPENCLVFTCRLQLMEAQIKAIRDFIKCT